MKKLILLLVLVLTFVACQKEDPAMKIVNGQDELVYKIISPNILKAKYTDAEWNEMAKKHEALKFQTKVYTSNPPDDLQWDGHYVVPTNLNYVGEGNQMNAYYSPSTGEIWGVIFTYVWMEGELGSGWVVSGTDFTKILDDGSYWDLWLYLGNWHPVQL